MSQKISTSSLRPGRTAIRAAFGSLLIAAAAVAVQPSFAHGGGEYRHGGKAGHSKMMDGGRHMGRMLDVVDATDAQRAQIKQIRQDAAAKMKPLREAGRGLRERGRQLLVSQNAVDRSGAETIRLESVALHDQMSKIRLESMLAVSDVLTPQQRAKLGEMAAKRGERMRDRMKRHHGDPAAAKS